LSEETIKTITGHITSPMVAKYVKDANQRKLAKGDDGGVGERGVNPERAGIGKSRPVTVANRA
jgi:hypothetical protein